MSPTMTLNLFVGALASIRSGISTIFGGGDFFSIRFCRCTATGGTLDCIDTKDGCYIGVDAWLKGCRMWWKCGAKCLTIEMYFVYYETIFDVFVILFFVSLQHNRARPYSSYMRLWGFDVDWRKSGSLQCRKLYCGKAHYKYHNKNCGTDLYFKIGETSYRLVNILLLITYSEQGSKAWMRASQHVKYFNF